MGSCCEKQEDNTSPKEDLKKGLLTEQNNIKTVPIQYPGKTNRQVNYAYFLLCLTP